MGLLMNIMLGIVERAMPAPFQLFGIALGGMDRLPDCWVHRRVLADLDRPRATGAHSVRVRAAPQISSLH